MSQMYEFILEFDMVKKISWKKSMSKVLKFFKLKLILSKKNFKKNKHVKFHLKRNEGNFKLPKHTL